MLLEDRSPGLPVAVIDNTLLSRLVSLEIAEFLPAIFDQIRIPPEVKIEAEASPNKEKLFELLNTGTDFYIDCLRPILLIRNFLKLY